MSASDRWGDYQTPCPDCGGVVHFWSFGSDDSYSPGSAGIQCKGCKKEFTRAVWEKIARKELKDEIAARKKSQKKYEAREEKRRALRRGILAKLTDEEIMELGYGLSNMFPEDLLNERGVEALLEKKRQALLRRR